jgi:NAD(P)-dependent dehydrogenase (short-subunit alcohol dehydrogenase family)
VVTGAFGRLGLEIASWLIEQGASHLALVGRRDPSQMRSPELMRQLDLWRGRGITVLAEVCDVSDESQVRELLVRIGTSGRSIRGVIHAAGGLHFHPILEASPREAEVVMRAKVEGARILDRATRAMPLDFFVLFGSGAATIGLRNGALYAAANSGLDAVAAGRRSAGLPVLCVEWGLWKHPGEDRQSALVEESGFRPMPPAKALRALAALINAGRSSALVADIDWAFLGSALEMRGRHALVTELMAASPSRVKVTDAPQDTAWLQLLRGLPPSDRKHKLLDLVGGEVRTIFGMMPEDPLEEDRGLFQMGMDSLMSVRLKRRFEAGSGLRLPGTLTLTYPTVLALAAYLEEKLFPDVEPASPSLREAHEESIAVSIAGMDEAETNAAIAAELAEIQQKLGVL